MLITPELQNRFEKSFLRIVKTLPFEVQKKWDGVISWPNEHSYPIISSDLISQFPPQAKAMYVMALNNLSRG